MSKTEEMVTCRTPTPGKSAKRIAKWKYDAVRDAILAVVPSEGEGLPLVQLSDRVERQLSGDVRAKLGSILWYAITVKLNMEVEGELRRVPGSQPQRLLRAV